jgi:hypothetical protein
MWVELAQSKSVVMNCCDTVGFPFSSLARENYLITSKCHMQHSLYSFTYGVACEAVSQ